MKFAAQYFKLLFTKTLLLIALNNSDYVKIEVIDLGIPYWHRPSKCRTFQRLNERIGNGVYNAEDIDEEDFT